MCYFRRNSCVDFFEFGDFKGKVYEFVVFCWSIVEVCSIGLGGFLFWSF